LNGNNILAKEQFGFRHHSSTEKAIYELLNEILNALTNRSMIGGIFCDLEKAFDCVNHDIQGGSNMTGTNCDLFTHK
jgi:hypothetical protein